MEDVSTATQVINQAELADVGEALSEPSDVEADWAATALNLNLDTLTVIDGDRMVAVAQVNAERADVHVLPNYRGRGIGVGLLEWSERRAKSQTEPGVEPRVGQTVPSHSPAAELLERRGYEPLWDSWILRLPASVELERRTTPGIEVRHYRPGEEEAIHSVLESAFSRWPGRTPQSFSSWQEQVMNRSDFDPSLLFVAASEEEVVGAVFGIDYSDEGWVDQVAVAPSHRNKGIASALLVALSDEFRARGQTAFGLNTDSRTGALDLYLRLGMKVERSFTRWSRALEPIS